MKLVYLVLISIATFSVVAAEENSADEMVDIDPILRKHTDEATAVDHLSDEELLRLLLADKLKKGELISVEQEALIMEQVRRGMEATKRKTPPNPVHEILSISTSPGGDLPTVLVTPGVLTYINVIDSTGEPWKIVHQSGGDTADFPIKPITAGASNIIEAQSTYRVGDSNVTLLLEGLDYPITFRLQATKSKYHPSVYLQMDKAGPRAKQEVYQGVSSIRNTAIMNRILLGLKPNDEYKKVKTSHVDVEAWKLGENLFIRANNLVPQHPISDVRHGPNGYTAYQITFLPILRFSDANGNQIRVTVEGA